MCVFTFLKLVGNPRIVGSTRFAAPRSNSGLNVHRFVVIKHRWRVDFTTQVYVQDNLTTIKMAYAPIKGFKVMRMLTNSRRFWARKVSLESGSMTMEP